MKNEKTLQAYKLLKHGHNDLRILAGSDLDPDGFTLLAILRNEMYFLPTFLDHYRRFGIQRFVFLDDHSDDGSFEFLAQQPDVIVVGSNRRFGDKVEILSSMSKSIKEFRIHFLWRSILYDMFACERWALHVDLDEFIHLPLGMTFADLASELDKQGVRAVWGVMLDVYPKDIAAFSEMEGCSRLDASATWYFDAEPHLRLRQDHHPKTIYPGARARLFYKYGIDRMYPLLGVRGHDVIQRFLRKTRIYKKPLRYNSIVKPALLKWDHDCYFKSPHSTNLSASKNYLLPIQHFRFSGSLGQRIHTALRERTYFLDSSDYRLMSELLHAMRNKGGSFLYEKSKKLNHFEDFVDTRNAVGF